jgi:DNA modification methylase
LAKDPGALRAVGRALREIPTHHRLYLGDSREMHDVDRESVHLVVTSPPYFDLKAYPDHEAQLGAYHDYEVFLKELDRVWEACRRVLVKGGRLIVIVGDVCRSRKAYGEHQVIPLHASIAHRCHQLGFNNLSTIVWHKIANAAFEVENGSSFLGKPYEPNAVIKNDIEYLLMLRKPGGYRRPTEAMRILSLISEKQHRAWFNQILRIPGASTRLHPAPYPMELAQRLIRMFSFVGDTVLDPFCGTGTTSVAAARSGRNSIGIEVEETYHRMAVQRLEEVAAEGVFRARVQSAHM